jgi:DNA polymerase-4
MATNQAKPNGQLWIKHGAGESFFSATEHRQDPRTWRKHLPKTLSIRYRKIGDLQKVNVKFLEAVFGKMGTYIYNKANGIDDTEIVPTATANLSRPKPLSIMT